MASTTTAQDLATVVHVYRNICGWELISSPLLPGVTTLRSTDGRGFVQLDSEGVVLEAAIGDVPLEAFDLGLAEAAVIMREALSIA